MAHTVASVLRPHAGLEQRAVPAVATSTDPASLAYVILRVGFTALPIIAGADKFFHVLVNWDQYLSPTFANLVGGSPGGMMIGVGVVEILAGIVVAIAPELGAYVVMGWLWGIIVNLLLIPGYFDIALRDFGLSLGALALAQLSRAQRRQSTQATVSVPVFS